METTTHKDLDCLKMKEQVQAELQAQVAHMAPEEELEFHRTYPLGEEQPTLIDRIRAARSLRTRAA